MSEDIQNLLILHQMFIVQHDYTMILWKFPKNLICLIYSRRENVVETPWGRRALAIHVEDAW